MMRRIIVTAIQGLLLTVSAAAQSTTGTIIGTIADPSQAAMAGVDVTVVNVDTGVARSVITGATGVYTVPSLLPGVYSITVRAPGFKRATVENIVLRVDQELRHDITMQLGETSEQVTVAAEAVAVGTETPSMGTGIVDREIVTMP